MNEQNETLYSPIYMMEGVELKQSLDLPEVEFEIDKIKYKATDLRLLNNYAIHAFNIIMSEIKEKPDIVVATFDVTDVEQTDIFAIQEIILGLRCSAKRRGKNGFDLGTHLIADSCRRGENTLTFDLRKSHIKSIYDYLNASVGPWQYTEIVRACVKADLDDFKNFTKDKENNND